MSKPRKYKITLDFISASLCGVKDPWGRKWIYRARTGTITENGDNYKEALLKLANRLEFPE